MRINKMGEIIDDGYHWSIKLAVATIIVAIIFIMIKN